MSVNRRSILTITTAIALISIAVVYIIFDPTLPWFPRCPWHELTGWQCPGCGSQRAIHAILNGHFAEAFRYNALIFVLIPIAVAVIALETFRPKRFDRLRLFLTSYPFILGTLIVIVLWTILRNIL